MISFSKLYLHFFSLSCLPSKPSHVPNALYWLLVANKWCWLSFLVWLLYFPTGTILFYCRFLSVTSSCFGPLMLQKPNDMSSAMYLIFTSIFCSLYFLSCLLPQFFLSKLLRVVFLMQYILLIHYSVSLMFFYFSLHVTSVGIITDLSLYLWYLV